ncbi:BCCT family transporter [Novosphingobium sp. B 225]|uniref:BCCT family transporter n=1 Tax=Novosphingobium sp. B 225 TaxID=1961849 RepID=UPI000B4BBEB2|nr:BCCT family transporter [Novosphingobium sp. B 225]
MTDWADAIDTGDYGKSSRTFLGMQVDPLVFFPTALLSLAVIVYSVLAPEQSASLFNSIRVGATTRFDWFFMSAGNLLLLFCVAVAVSPLGRIRLGGKGAAPDYSRMSWFAMLFGAGMGIGLVFYGVSEPVSHFTAAMAGGPAAPLGGAAGDAAVSRDLAMAATIFDWALHPWAIFAVTGLALALFAYDFNMPLSMRSAFYPLFGKAVWGRLGDGIEVLAVFATIFGLATSLGLGAQQAMAGVTFLYGIPSSPTTILALIAIMSAVTFLSVRGGIDRGIRILSEANMWMALALLLFVLLTGSAMALLSDLVRNTVNYLWYLPALSNPVGRTDQGFYRDWSVYYWAWWISWAPFVGMFMARISLGRTVREFIAGAMIAPSLLGILWLTIFGDASIAGILSGQAASLQGASLETQLFELLRTLPWAQVTSFAAIVLILVFFVTGWDSGTLVIDTMTSGGRTDTPLRQKVIWLFAVGGIGVVLLLSGGLSSLQAGSIATGLPLALVLLLMCWGTLKGLLAIHRRA